MFRILHTKRRFFKYEMLHTKLLAYKLSGTLLEAPSIYYDKSYLRALTYTKYRNLSCDVINSLHLTCIR